MKPKNQSNNYEKVSCGDWIKGEIMDIMYDDNHTFTYEGKDRQADAARIVFRLEGYDMEHSTRWMTFNYGKKSNLYNKFLVKLVENAKPNMEFDLDLLKGLPIKVMYEQIKEYQKLAMIEPTGKKVAWSPDIVNVEAEETEVEGSQIADEDEIPF